MTAFATIDGRPVGIVANQPLALAGTLDIPASQKAARFVAFCDAFNLPIVTLVDTPGFYPGKDLEWRGMIRHGAQLVFAYARATVPRICLILRKSYGGAYIVMDSKTMGNDACFAWPWAELAVMGAGQAAAILQRRATPEERAAFEADYTERLLNPYVAAERGFIDAVLEPADTRRDHPVHARSIRTRRTFQASRSDHGSRTGLHHRSPSGSGGGNRRSGAVINVADVPDTITITDDRTGKTVTVPVTDGVFPSSALRELDKNLFMYDPAYLSTAACRSAITYLDGDNGVLRYRGYPIEQLAEHSTYLEVAYLLLYGELPNEQQLDQWTFDVTHHTFIHENMRKRFVDGFHYDAHPMGMFISSLAALGTFYDDAKDIFDSESRHKQILRLIAKAPTLAAMCYRFSVGLPFFLPDNSLSYPANFLTMMWKVGEYEVHPAIERAMDVLFILHADHEQNCGTTAMRVVASSNADPYSAAAAAAAALYGPLHGGANEAVVRMLGEIGSVDQVPAFVEDVKSGKGRLMGFGHRVYKNYDPRAGSSSRRPTTCST